jgi:hypothetical protein
VSEKLDPEALAADLEVLRNRIARIAAAIVDAEIHDRLASLLGHVSVAATTLRQPTRANLARAAQRLRYATKQLDLLTGWPGPKPRRPSTF